jgi:hypothetical protein
MKITITRDIRRKTTRVQQKIKQLSNQIDLHCPHKRCLFFRDKSDTTVYKNKRKDHQHIFSVSYPYIRHRTLSNAHLVVC